MFVVSSVQTSHVRFPSVDVTVPFVSLDFLRDPFTEQQFRQAIIVEEFEKIPIGSTWNGKQWILKQQTTVEEKGNQMPESIIPQEEMAILEHFVEIPTIEKQEQVS